MVKWVRRSVCVAALAVLLSGCGAGLGLSLGGGGEDDRFGNPEYRAWPLIGNYLGTLHDFGAQNRLVFQTRQDGTVVGYVRLNDGTELPLQGSIDSDRRLTLNGDSLTVNGWFGGDYNPDNGVFDPRGWRLFGNWFDSSGNHGQTSAWHESWPPPVPSSGWYDDFDDDYPWFDYDSGGGSTGGGSTGGGSTGGSTGGGSTGGGSTGGGVTQPDPIDTGGGDPSNDPIILRRTKG